MKALFDKLNRRVEVGRPSEYGADQRDQFILSPRLRKLVDALPPKGSNACVQIEGPAEIGKTLAVREYVKTNGGSVVFIKRKRRRNLFQRNRARGTGRSPVEAPPLTLGEYIAQQPASFQHSLKKFFVQLVELLFGKRHGGRSAKANVGGEA